MNPIANRSAGRPPAFSYREVRQGFLRRRPVGSALLCDEVALERLAERFGTPLYVYSALTIRERMTAFEHAFRKVPHTVCYSVKANSSLGILRLLAGMGFGFDVVSGGELERVLRVDRRAAKKAVFSGVGKTADEMQAALKAGVMLFNVESESELWRLAECAARAREKARIALRVNPDVPANTHPYISTGLQQHKFGIPISKARKLYAQASGTKYLKIAGVSVHIGSQITDVQPFALAMKVATGTAFHIPCLALENVNGRYDATKDLSRWPLVHPDMVSTLRRASPSAWRTRAGAVPPGTSWIPSTDCRLRQE